MVERALSEGAHISHQANLPDARGHFFAPTVLSGVAPDAAILREEIFGPVPPIVAWRDEKDLLSHVNATEYCLAAYVFDADLERALTWQSGSRWGSWASTAASSPIPRRPSAGSSRAGSVGKART